MALPPNLNLITVTGTFVDSTGIPHSGKVTFRPTERRRDPSARVIVTPKEKFAVIDERGSFSISIPATDDPDLFPRGGGYGVEVSLNGYSYSFTLAVPHDVAGGTLDLSHLSDSAVPVPVTSPITAASLGGEMRINRAGAEPGFVVVLGANGDLKLAPNTNTGSVSPTPTEPTEPTEPTSPSTSTTLNDLDNGTFDGGDPTTLFNSYTYALDGGDITTSTATFGSVTSVNGRSGAVVLGYTDVGAAHVDHLHDDRYYTRAESRATFVRSVNGVRPDTTGNVQVSGGGGTGTTTTVSTLRGVNIFGPETLAGAVSAGVSYGETYGETYAGSDASSDIEYDSQASLNFLAQRGHRVVRVPLSWERLQPTLNGPLATIALNRLIEALARITTSGMQAILSLNNDCRRIDVDGIERVMLVDFPASVVADFWNRMAAVFKDNTTIVGYGLMNEPHGLPTSSTDPTGARGWESASQTMVNAIRSTGDATPVYVSGYNRARAHTWALNHARPWITDSINQVFYESHYFFDRNTDGIYEFTYGDENANAVAQGYADLRARAVDELQKFTDWCATHTVNGFIGEIGWPNNVDTASWNAVGDVLYRILDTARIGATVWTASERWPADYNLSVYKPSVGVSPPVLGALTSVSTIVEAHPSLTTSTGGGGGGTSYTDANAVSAIGGKLWFGTQASYDALGAWDVTTLYVVTA